MSALAVVALGAAPPAAAQPILWPGNGHYYELVETQLYWTAARDAAAAATYLGLPGRLVTITSAAENAFVANQVVACGHVWIGLSDAAQEGTFAWVDGEPFAFTNWAPGEPNDWEDEDYVELVAECGGWHGRWNDADNDFDGGRFYVVEYGVETGEPPTWDPPPATGPVLWPENGHYYQLVRSGVSWTEARDAAAAAVYRGGAGHLVTITSAAENAFVVAYVAACEIVWIGLTDEAQEGTFAWVTGEPLSFTAWNAGEPNGGESENYGELQGDCGETRGLWNDLSNQGGRFYIIEYEQARLIPALGRAGLLALAIAVLALAVRRLT